MTSYKMKNLLGIALLICLLLFSTAGIFFNAVIDVNEVHYLIICGIFCFLISDSFKRIEIICLSLLFFFLYLCFNFEILLLIFEFFVLIFTFYLHPSKNDKLAMFVILASFIFHLFYIQHTNVDVRQHDLSASLSYIHNIMTDINFSPWKFYYFFHQPLHFIFSGILLFLESYFWNSSIIAHEGLQYYSLFFVTATTIVCAYILKKLNLSQKNFYAALILLAFNPTLTLFSGYISDDVDVLFWIVLTTYFIINWYQSEKIKYILIAAFCFALGTLTKLSMLMLVPSISFLFLIKLIKSSNKKNIWISIFSFIIIAVPLSLIWIIRNHVLFDMQFYNIPDTSPEGQNFFNLSLWERISDFSKLFSPFINAPHIADNNLWLALIKTELFGEWDYSLLAPIVKYPAFMLYVLNILIKISVLFILIFSGLKLLPKSKNINPIIVFFALQYLIVWGYSFNYALSYPYICSSDYRLFAQLIVPEIILLANFNKKETGENIFLTVSITYAILSIIIYLVIL